MPMSTVAKNGQPTTRSILIHKKFNKTDITVVIPFKNSTFEHFNLPDTGQAVRGQTRQCATASLVLFFKKMDLYELSLAARL